MRKLLIGEEILVRGNRNCKIYLTGNQCDRKGVEEGTMGGHEGEAGVSWALWGLMRSSRL